MNMHKQTVKMHKIEKIFKKTLHVSVEDVIIMQNDKMR